MQEQIIQRLDSIENLLLSQKRALTLKEAAKFTGRSISNLYKLTSTCSIPHYKGEGKMITFEREELETWMLRNPVKTNYQIEMEAATQITLKKGGVRC
ncbi:helix-turn-helix domain-containing protein [Adhaeribacter aquaticus]|uniref:helix-turn-helix domain-containing protein n=1 Tax=Adhaeribacter aquaticus TaxID=299567 RepID=UPI00047C14E1|nr:helix-turn-helix domain-containing protein [Adhaeribacter aquaticus]